MNIQDLLIISISISMILYYIYETDFIWEYLNKISSLLNFKITNKIMYGILLLKSYPLSGDPNYLQFINKTYNTFLTRLLSCPICSGFWISVFFSLFYNFMYALIIAFLSLCIYFFLKILTKLSHNI